MNIHIDCENYLDGFCLKDIGDGRVWYCTALNEKERSKFNNREIECPYPKLGKTIK